MTINFFTVLDFAVADFVIAEAVEAVGVGIAGSFTEVKDFVSNIGDFRQIDAKKAFLGSDDFLEVWPDLLMTYQLIVLGKGQICRRGKMRVARSGLT